jgi:O-antigen ligase
VLLFFLSAAAAAFLQQPVFLLVPFGMLVLTYLLVHPEYLYYILLASIPWSIEFNFTPSLGTDLPDEPLMLIVSFLALAGIIWQRKKLGTRPLHPLLWILILQLAWTLVTVFTSTYPDLSAKYFIAKCWYLLAFVAAPLLLFRNEQVLRRATIILLSSMVLFMLVTQLRHAANGWTFERINDSVRPFFRNHVNYSALLVFMVPLQIAVLRLATKRYIRISIAVILVITIAALYFSYARGAWVALAAGLFSYWLIRHKYLLRSWLIFLVLSIAAVFYLKSNDRYMKFAPDYNSTIFHTNFREHLIATYQLKDVSTAERFYRWIAGVRMIGDSWMVGFGPSSFYRQYKSYTQPAFKTWVSRNRDQSTVHNYFLLLIIEQGVIGLLLFLLLLGALFWYAQNIYHRTTDRFWKVVVAAVSAILVMECTINFLSDMIETDKAGSIFYLCVAVLVLAERKANVKM